MFSAVAHLDGRAVPEASRCLPPSPPGLAELAARKYKQAAKCFLLASFDHCDFPEVRAHKPRGRGGEARGWGSPSGIRGGVHLAFVRRQCLSPQLLSPSNVAVYGGLCALATFDRQELQRNVISSRWGCGPVPLAATLGCR